MLTEKDYCDYDTCVALKELGYKVPTSAYYLTNDTTLYFVSNPFRGGYAIDCFYSHNSLREGVVTSNYIDAPTMWEAQKWLREKEIYVSVIPEYNELGPVKGVKYRLEVAHWKDDDFGYETIEWLDEEEPYVVCCFDSYEEALLEGVKAAVNILKEERK